MGDTRTHEQVVGIIGILAQEAYNDAVYELEELGPQTRHSIEWLTATDAALRAKLATAEARAEKYEAALRPFCDPESYTTTEEVCRRNHTMDWCAIHSFRWPCPVSPARRALAGGGK